MKLDLTEQYSSYGSTAQSFSDSSVGLNQVVKPDFQKWELCDWDRYLSIFEKPAPPEEILVGSGRELEEYVATKSQFGSVPGSSVDENIKLKNQK